MGGVYSSEAAGHGELRCRRAGGVALGHGALGRSEARGRGGYGPHSCGNGGGGGEGGEYGPLGGKRFTPLLVGSVTWGIAQGSPLSGNGSGKEAQVSAIHGTSLFGRCAMDVVGRLIATTPRGRVVLSLTLKEAVARS